jgi:hypothetical protein
MMIALDQAVNIHAPVVGGDIHAAVGHSGRWAASCFPDSGIGAISCCTLPVQVLVVNFLRSPVAER